jgi:hypothetical protein
VTSSNYVDYYRNAVDAADSKMGYSAADVALTSSGDFKLAYKNINNPDSLPDRINQSYLLKPSMCSTYVDYWSKAIEIKYHISGSYLDVHSSVAPSVDYVDYDSSVANAGMFRTTLQHYRGLYNILRKNHGGPVQGEGGAHLLYLGYADDVEARITSPTSHAPGYNFPILIDFDLKNFGIKDSLMEWVTIQFGTTMMCRQYQDLHLIKYCHTLPQNLHMDMEVIYPIPL